MANAMDAPCSRNAALRRSLIRGYCSKVRHCAAILLVALEVWHSGTNGGRHLHLTSIRQDYSYQLPVGELGSRYLAMKGM